MGVGRDLELVDVVRPATTAELAALYGWLADRGNLTPVPTVVFAGVAAGLPAAATVDRLRSFGIAALAAGEATALPAGRGAYVLGGPLHGRCLTPGGDDREHVATIVALLERARLRDWARRAGEPGDPEFVTLHTPGSDSRGVVRFRLSGTGAEVVAKVGDAGPITAEARFATGVNAVLAEEGRPGLFPTVYGVALEGGQAVSVMAAGDPLPIAELFADAERTTLDDAAVSRLEPHLDALGAWYRRTARPVRPTAADYLYRERYDVLRTEPAFRSTFGAFFGDVAPETLLAASVRLPGGLVVPGWSAASAWLADLAPALLPDRGSAVHGDIYAANMLTGDGGRPLLIDPRTVWEGRDRPDVGYGDPVFDLATLLHGVFPMAAILRAVEEGASDRLWSAPVRPDTTPLDLGALALPIRFPASVAKLEARLLEIVPAGEPLRVVRTRLYVGAATSLAGWLKYERSLRTAQAWLATYAFTTWYLWQARRIWQEGA